MRTSTDVLRSLKRYLNLALPGYNLILDGEQGTAKRPMGVIKASSPNNEEGNSSAYEDLVETFTIYVYPAPGDNVQDSRVKAGGIKNRVERLLGSGILFDEDAEAWVQADNGVGRRLLMPLYDYEDKTWKQGTKGYAETRLDGAVTLPASEVGVLDADDFSPKGIAYIGTEVVTYTGKNETALTGVAGGEGPIPDNTLVRQYGDRLALDYTRVLDLSVDAVQSPDDETLYTVLAEVRMGWRRGSLLPSNAEMADSVRISFS